MKFEPRQMGRFKPEHVMNREHTQAGRISLNKSCHGGVIQFSKDQKDIGGSGKCDPLFRPSDEPLSAWKSEETVRTAPSALELADDSLHPRSFFLLHKISNGADRLKICHIEIIHTNFDHKSLFQECHEFDGK